MYRISTRIKLSMLSMFDPINTIYSLFFPSNKRTFFHLFHTTDVVLIISETLGVNIKNGENTFSV